MGRRESRPAELEKLRAELVKRLDQLDFRAESLDQAFAEMAQHAECTIRRLTS
jgi:prefoldin subunit 5